MFLISTHSLGNQQKSVSASDQSFFHELFTTVGFNPSMDPFIFIMLSEKVLGF